MKLQGKRILVFTGGGVAPALNATLAGIAFGAKKEGATLLGGFDGWASLAKDGGKISDLSQIDPNKLKAVGGTILRTSRTNPFKEKGGIAKLKASLKKHAIDFIIAIGGDDTQGAAFRVYEDLSIPIVGAPKTIDNDLSATYWTPGFPTAAATLISFTAGICRTAFATKKVYIIESLGGKAGWLPAASIFGGANIVIPPERKINLNYLLDRIKKLYAERGCVVIVVSHTANLGERVRSEYAGREDQFGITRTFFISLGLRRIVEDALKGPEVKVAVPGNYLSAANPVSIDKEFASRLGQKAVELISNGEFGQMARIEKTEAGFTVSAVPLGTAVGKYRNIEDENLFDFYNFTPTVQFCDYLREILGDQTEIFNPQDLLPAL